MTTAPLDLDNVIHKLEGENEDYWFHLQAESKLDKYPAKQHARDVATNLGVETGLIYLAGEKTIMFRDSDQARVFRQRRYFYYLTGCNESDCHMLYDIASDVLTLFIPEIDLRKAVWGGAGSSKAEAHAKYDVDVVEYTAELPKAIERWQSRNEAVLYVLDPYEKLPGDIAYKGKIDGVRLQGAIDLNRVIKYPHEIALIRRANKISEKAHTAVLKDIRNFKNEREVEGMFLETCIAAGAHNQAYNIIAGSGTNAAVLHYGKNDEPLEDRQVLLIDAGAEWNCYASDVTRTFPISGYWSTEAKNIYDLVNDMQAQCIALMRPGVHYRDLQILANVIATKGLIELGILKGDLEEILKAGTTRAFFPHGLGHHVGLEVHDVLNVPIQSTKELPMGDLRVYNGTDLHGKSPAFISELYNLFIDPSVCLSPVTVDSPTLDKGMVVTVEPGIYFNGFALTTVYLADPKHARFINKEVLSRYLPVGGVRIEDDILITKSGYENLTTAPKGDEALSIIRGDDEVCTSESTTSKLPRAEKGKAPIRHAESMVDETSQTVSQSNVVSCSRNDEDCGDVLPPMNSKESLLSSFPFRTECTPRSIVQELREIMANQQTRVHRLFDKVSRVQHSSSRLRPEQIKEFAGIETSLKAILATYASDDYPRRKALFVQLTGDAPWSSQYSSIKTGDCVLSDQNRDMCQGHRNEAAQPKSRELRDNETKLDELLRNMVKCYHRARSDYEKPRCVSNHLDVRKGDVVKVLDKTTSGLWYVLLGQHRGYVDSAILEDIPVSEHPDTSCTVQAVYSYDGCYEEKRDPTCLMFKRNEIVSILTTQTQYHGWWIGQVNGLPGWLPSSFVRDIALPGPTLPHKNLDMIYAKALYKYEGTTEESGHLPFERDDILQIFNRQDSRWWYACLSSNIECRGWIPATFVRELTEVESLLLGVNIQLNKDCPALTPADATKEEHNDEERDAEATEFHATQKEKFTLFCKTLAAALCTNLPNNPATTATLDSCAQQIRQLLQNTNREEKLCFAGLCLQLKHDDPQLDLTLRDEAGVGRLKSLYRALRESMAERDDGDEVLQVVGVKLEDDMRKEDVDVGICMRCVLCRSGFATWDEKWLAVQTGPEEEEDEDEEEEDEDEDEEDEEEEEEEEIGSEEDDDDEKFVVGVIGYHGDFHNVV